MFFFSPRRIPVLAMRWQTSLVAAFAGSHGSRQWCLTNDRGSTGLCAKRFSASEPTPSRRKQMLRRRPPKRSEHRKEQSQEFEVTRSIGDYDNEEQEFEMQVHDDDDDDLVFDFEGDDEDEDDDDESSNRNLDHLNVSDLNEEQKDAADRILKGQSAFLTGAAGTGKSHLLKYIIQAFQATYPGGIGKEIAVTASTGIAATHIGGVTVHSWAGIGLGKGDPETLYKKVYRNKVSRNRWKKAEVLIIDEVSMLSGELFQSLDYIGKKVRGCPDKPFGGLQVVLCGDFFQLQPVTLRTSGFAFQSGAWIDAGIETIELTEVTRQAGDLPFAEALGHLRKGDCPPMATKLISKCHVSKKSLPNDGIDATRLYCTNKDVDAENFAKLDELPGITMSYTAIDKFNDDCDPKMKSVLKGMMDKKIPKSFDLKVGAQVMLTRNIPHRNLVNGSRGVVVRFVRDRKSNDISSKPKIPLVRFSDGTFMPVRPDESELNLEGSGLVRTQVPLKLAWCLTVHKAQGMTLDRAEVQLEDAFAYGQVYIALSRVKSLDGLWIRGKSIPKSALRAHPDVVEFYNSLT